MTGLITLYLMLCLPTHADDCMEVEVRELESYQQCRHELVAWVEQNAARGWYIRMSACLREDVE